MARPRQVSDEEIIAAARACIAEYGPNVSTAKIAERVGVSAQALLKRFGGKEQLLLAALKPPERPEWVAHLPDEDDERPLVEQLRDVTQAASVFFEGIAQRIFAIQWSTLPTSLLRDGYDTPPPVYVVETVTRWLEQMHRRGLAAEVDFRVCATAMLGSIHVQSMLQYALGFNPSGRDRADYIDGVAELYARMLAP